MPVCFVDFPIQNCRTRWGPSIHRDLHGENNDHALLECVWKWRIRNVKTRTRKDFSCLYTQKRDTHGNPKKTVCMQKFEATVESKLTELNYNAMNDSTSTMYEKICTAIHSAMETHLPTRRRGTSVRRRVSERTKALFKHRSALCKTATQEQFAQVQKQSKKAASPTTRNGCKSGQLRSAMHAESIGDTRGIYKGVKALARKQDKPPTNLTTDSAGNMYA